VTTAIGDVTIQITNKDPQAERERLDKEIAKVDEELRTVEEKLKNKSFINRAPAAVVEEHRQRKANFTEQLKKLKEARDKLD
jgi:valyl-tRNA synthetase